MEVMMLRNLRLKAAYGRRYLTEEACLEAWQSGADFKIKYSTSPSIMGRYCSIRDFGPNQHVAIEYGQYHEEMTIAWGKE
jgi:hypothetical protein